MIRLFKDYHLPQHMEIVFMLVIGILLQMMDGSPFTLKERWKVVWETDLPSNHFNPFVQKFIKMLLSVIVTIRCTTTYAYVVAAMLVIFCIVKRTVPKLMCLWLLVAVVKPISMIFLEGLTGVYVCSAFGRIRKACIEFFVVKALELIFSTYLWGSVLSIYKDIEKELEDKNKNQEKENVLLKKQDFRRLRARSLIDESSLSKSTYFNNFERRDVPFLILQMLKREDEMSEDSLLAPGMMLASVSNLGSFDNIKTSQSLGELGFTDLTTADVFGIEENENLTKQEKVLRFLKLTGSEVRKIRLNKSSLEKDIYNVGDDIWNRVIASGIRFNYPKQQRTEIFLRKISPTDLTDEKHESHRPMSLRSLVSLLYIEKQVDLQEDEKQNEEGSRSRDEEDEDDESIFMSNVKDGTTINRIHMGRTIKKLKGTEYATLYKKKYMSKIGPEVFDKATKLPKLTSLSKIRNVTHRVMSSPDLSMRKRKIKYQDEESGEEKAILTLDSTSEGGPHSHRTPDSLENVYHKEGKRPIPLVTGLQVWIRGQGRKETEVKRGRIKSVEEGVEGEEALQTTGEEKTASDNEKFEEAVSKLQIGDDETNKTKPKDEDKKSVDKEAGKAKPKDEEVGKTEIKSDVKAAESKLGGKKSSELKVDDKERTETKQIRCGKVVEEDRVNRKSYLHEAPCLGARRSDKSLAKAKPIYKKRRVMIRWVGQRKPKLLYRSRMTGNQSPSDDSDSFTDLSPISEPEQEGNDSEGFAGSERVINSKSGGSLDRKRNKGKKLKGAERKEIYFVRELFNKPLYDVLITYYDLKKRVYLSGTARPPREKFDFPRIPRRRKIAKETTKMLNSFALGCKGVEKKWKSDVLKRSEPRYHTFPSTFEVLLNTLKKRAAIKKLLKYEYHYVMRKYRRLHESDWRDIEYLSSDELMETDTSNDSDNYSRVSEKLVESKNSLLTSDTSLCYTTDSLESDNPRRPSKHHPDESPSEVLSTADSELQPSNHAYLDTDDDAQESISDIKKLEKGVEPPVRIPDALANDPARELLSSQESDEPISLYYSKAANLASPLLDMKGFIYPDHIHYSYKHVKKRGFDVDINGGFPLLMRESLTVGGSPVKMEHKWEGKRPDCEITRRPMDLSFAKTNAFAEWQTNDQNDAESSVSETILPSTGEESTEDIKLERDLIKAEVRREKGLRKHYHRPECRHSIEKDINKAKCKAKGQNSNVLKYLFQAKDSMLPGKFHKIHKKLNPDGFSGIKKTQRSPVQISSTQLHSNKGHLSPTCNPAIYLQENRTNSEKKRLETQKERTRDMFARLEREVLLQNKAVQKLFSPNRRT